MRLLTKAIARTLPPLYSTESVPLVEKIVRCKFFNPCGTGTWYVIEGEEKERDWLFFGLVKLHCQEWGLFRLSELASVKLRFGLRIERDLYFEPGPIREHVARERIEAEVLR